MAIKYKNDDRLVWKNAVPADFNSSFLQVDRYSIPSFCQYCYYFQAQVQNCRLSKSENKCFNDRR